MFSYEDQEREDWRLLQNGAVNLFWRMQALEKSVAALRALDYRILRVRYAGWDDFRVRLSSELSWREQFGYEPWTGEPNALDDALHNYPFEETDKVALVIERFHQFWAENEGVARNLLDTLEDASRTHLLASCRFIALIQTDDNRFDPGQLGGRTPQWYGAEWFSSGRGL